MKIVAIDAGRGHGPLNLTLSAVADAAEKAGAQVGFLRLSDYRIRDCVNCKLCALGEGCKIGDDLEIVLEAIAWADGVIIGAPRQGSNRAFEALLTRLRTYFEEDTRKQPRLPGLESAETYLSKIARDTKRAIIISGAESEGGIGAFFNLGSGRERSLRHALAACNINAVGQLSVGREQRNAEELTHEQWDKAASMGRLIAGKV